MTTMPTSRGFLEDLARALHNGRTWGEIATALGDSYRSSTGSYAVVVLDLTDAKRRIDGSS